MHDEAFDRLIQQRLQDHEVTLTEGDWEAMVSHLSVDAESTVDQMLYNQLDDTISNSEVATAHTPYLDSVFKSKLESHAISGPNGQEWTELAARLYGNFDATIESAFEKYEVPYDPADWQAMLAYMDQPIYKGIREKLLHHTVTQDHADWKMLSQRLNQDVAVPHEKVDHTWYPYAIAASLALLLMLWLPLSEQQFIRSNRDKNHSSPITENTNDNSIAEDKYIGETKSSQSALDSDSQQSGKPTDKLTLPPTNPSTKSAQQLADATLDTEAFSSTIDTKAYADPVKLSLEDIDVELPIDQPTSERADVPALSILPDDEQSLFEPVPELESAPVLTASQSMDKQIFPVRNRDSQFDYTLLPPAESVELLDNRHRLDPEFWIGVYSGSASSMAELNDQGQFGAVGGVRVELRFNDLLTLVSGVHYAEKGYTHEFRTSQTRDNASGVIRVSQALEAQFSMVEIPALVRLTVPSEETHSFYVQLGIVPFIMLSEDYDSYNPNLAQNASIDPSSLNSFGFDPKEDLESVNHKMSFRTYVGNVHAAIGWEYGFSQRLRLQVEPYFQMGLQGIGPSSGSAELMKNLYTGGIATSLIFNSSKSARKNKRSKSN